MCKPPVILLSFDVEEFDLPLEYGLRLTPLQQMEKGMAGVSAMKELLDAVNISTTLFTTAAFAKNYPAAIRELSLKHEIASHSFYHSDFETADLLQSRITLEAITGKKVTGLRMPRMKQVPMQDLLAAGYDYDSSLNPTRIPGRYDHRDMPRLAFLDAGILRIPVSVTPRFRIPLFWLSFKNFPYALYKKLALQTLRRDGVLSIYFHPWELTDIKQKGLPAYISRLSGTRMRDRLYRLIGDLRAEAGFTTYDSYAQEKGIILNTDHISNKN